MGSIQELNRVFIVEPNLVAVGGHPIEYSVALQEVCLRNGVEVYIVCNKNIEAEALEFFRNPLPIISQTCFSAMDTKGMTFRDNLLELNQNYALTNDDLLIMTSAYTNEILGAAIFEQLLGLHACPKIALNFHQLFPPAPVAMIAGDSEYQRYWFDQLTNAFDLIPLQHTMISLWTTGSAGLHADYQMVARRPIGILPQLFAIPSTQESWEDDLDLPDGIRLAFLGDGRQEKGLLTLIETITRHLDLTESLVFVIQVVNIRGYDYSEESRLYTCLHQLEWQERVIIIREFLPPGRYHRLVQNMDGVILPYHPNHYAKRASGVFVQAALYKKPVIVSSGTWLADEVTQGRASGLVFDYVTTDRYTTMDNLAKAIRELRERIEDFRFETRERETYYHESLTADRYLQIILGYYR